MLRARACAALVTVGALVACTGGGSDGGSGDGPSDGGLTGDPVVVGFLNQEGSPAGDFPEARAGAEAAVTHVNEDLGGVDGRPLRLEACATNGTPESSQACAQQVLEEEPVAVVGGIDLGAESSVPVVTGAGLPYVTGSPTLIGELRNEGAFAFTGGVAGDLLALGQYLVTDKRTTRLAVLHADLPGLLNTAVAAAGTVLQARGVEELEVVSEKVDAPDFAPALSAAVAGDPEGLIVVFPAQACSRVLQAAASLALEVPVYAPGACATPAVVAAAGPVAERLTFASGYEPVPADGGDATAQAFRDGVPPEQRSPISQAAFSAVVNLHRLLADGATDGPALRDALAGAVDAPNVFAQAYTCDGAQVPLLSSVCNADVRLLQPRGGALVDVGGDWRNGAELTRGLGG